jgi:glycosyltransferase involved in cell wall biosynthesis
MISIIVPAHNESSVIARTLGAITEGAMSDELEVIVVCNGCSDDTASVARRCGPLVRVIETKIARKTHALNMGDRAARGFPRVYIDADVMIDLSAVRALVKRLEMADVQVVAPIAQVDLTGCSWAVRAFYEIRSYLPSAKEGIGGSGVYALSESGRRRFGDFPDVTADDGYVRIQFRPRERETLLCVNSTVFPPRTLKDLIATKTRSHYGSFELAKEFPDPWKNRGESNHHSIARLFKNPSLWPSLIAYGLVTIVARRRARKRFGRAGLVWERDNTSRLQPRPATSRPKANS